MRRVRSNHCMHNVLLVFVLSSFLYSYPLLDPSKIFYGRLIRKTLINIIKNVPPSPGQPAGKPIRALFSREREREEDRRMKNRLKKRLKKRLKNRSPEISIARFQYFPMD